LEDVGLEDVGLEDIDLEDIDLEVVLYPAVKSPRTTINLLAPSSRSPRRFPQWHHCHSHPTLSRV
jgi:hypothetical protein